VIVKISAGRIEIEVRKSFYSFLQVDEKITIRITRKTLTPYKYFYLKNAGGKI